MQVRLVALTLIIAILLTAGLTAAWERRDLAVGDAWLRLHPGAQAVVAEHGLPFRSVTDDRRLQPGDRVRMTSGGAALEMARGIDVELRAASDVTVDRDPRLHGGEVLVRTERTPLRLIGSSNSAATVAANSVVRLSRTLVYGAGVYRGDAVLDSARRVLEVPALRQGSISAVGVVSKEPSPILVDATDDWDRRYLGLAIELTRQLDAVSVGFSANVVTSARSLADVVLEAIPAARPDGLGAAVAARRRPGELLVGTAIATAAGRPSGPVFDFRDRGATWGLVALDQHVVDHDALFGLLQLALGQAPIVDTTIAAPPRRPPAAPSPNETARGGLHDTTSPAPDPSQDEPAVPSPSPDLGDGVEEVVEGVVDDAVEEVVDGAAGDVGDVVDIVREGTSTVIDAVDDTVGVSSDGAGSTTGTLLRR